MKNATNILKQFVFRAILRRQNGTSKPGPSGGFVKLLVLVHELNKQFDITSFIATLFLNAECDFARGTIHDKVASGALKKLPNRSRSCFVVI